MLYDNQYYYIKNIKGFGDPPVSLDVEIKPDKINLLIAPNGFGKSSLAAAFASIKPSKLIVEIDNKSCVSTKSCGRLL